MTTYNLDSTIYTTIGGKDVASRLLRFAIKHPSAVMMIHEDLIDHLNPNFIDISFGGAKGSPRTFFYCGVEVMCLGADERLVDKDESLYSTWLYTRGSDKYPTSEVITRG